MSPCSKLRWHSPQLVKSMGGGQDGTPVRSRSRFRGNVFRSAGPGTCGTVRPDRASEATPTRSHLRAAGSNLGRPSDLDPDLELSPFQPANLVSGTQSSPPPDGLPPLTFTLPSIEEPLGGPLEEPRTASEASDGDASPDLPSDLDPSLDPDPWDRSLWDSAAAAPAWEQKPLQV